MSYLNPTRYLQHNGIPYHPLAFTLKSFFMLTIRRCIGVLFAIGATPYIYNLTIAYSEPRLIRYINDMLCDSQGELLKKDKKDTNHLWVLYDIIKDFIQDYKRDIMYENDGTYTIDAYII